MRSTQHYLHQWNGYRVDHFPVNLSPPTLVSLFVSLFGVLCTLLQDSLRDVDSLKSHGRHKLVENGRGGRLKPKAGR